MAASCIQASFNIPEATLKSPNLPPLSLASPSDSSDQKSNASADSISARKAEAEKFKNEGISLPPHDA